MSYPILYDPNEKNFNHNGFGIMGDCVSCYVTEEANGEFELEASYPVDGIRLKNITKRSLIVAKPNNTSRPQIFRVYRISKPMPPGVVKIYASHISYDLSGIPISPFLANNPKEAFQQFQSKAAVANDFAFWTDKENNAPFKVSVPSSIRSCLGGSEGSIIDVFGGEYEFDNYSVKLHENRGENKGVSVRYGKNLTDIKQEENFEKVYTGVYPYWFDSATEKLVELPEKIINSSENHDFVRILPLDLTNDFEEEPTIDQIRSRANRYVSENNIGIPSVSLKVSFAQLDQTSEYSSLNAGSPVGLFDTVSVVFPDLSVSVEAKVVKTKYNVILDRMEEISIGNTRTSIADTVASQTKSLKMTASKTDVTNVQNSATDWLTNGKGYKVERRDSNGNLMDTLYMDRPDIQTAVNILRFGKDGVSVSNNGVNGQFNTIMTIGGTIGTASLRGDIDAEITKILNYVAEKLVSKMENKSLTVDGGELLLTEGSNKKTIVSSSLLSLRNDGSESNIEPDALGIGGTQSNPVFSVRVEGSDVKMKIGNEDSYKKLSWAENDDGSYSIIAI